MPDSLFDRRDSGLIESRQAAIKRTSTESFSQKRSAFFMQHRIRVGGDRLVFSAAHFILLEGGVCEPLHGHNYRISAEIAGPLNDASCVADFLAVEDALRVVLDELDHRVLVAMDQAAIQTTTTETEVELRFGRRRWVFPKSDCCLLPLPSTTAGSWPDTSGGGSSRSSSPQTFHARTTSASKSRNRLDAPQCVNCARKNRDRAMSGWLVPSCCLHC